MIMDKPQIIITFEPTTVGSFLVSVSLVTDEMHYREHYKKQSTYVFYGQKYDVYCMFNMSIVCSEKHALKIATEEIKRYELHGKKK